MIKSLAFLLLCALAATAGTDDTFLLRGATIHPVGASDIPNGAVLVRDGKIAEVGARIQAPRGVRVIEARGLHLYPGMIDSASQLGLVEISSVRETSDVSEIGDFNPQIRAAIAVNPASEHIPVTRANGITAAIALPMGGILAGQAALIHLDGWTWEEMEVSRSAALHLRFPLIQTVSGDSFRGPGRTPYADAKKKYEAELRNLRDFFEQARRYQKAKASGEPDFKTDLKLEAMLPVLEGKLPVMISAVRERAIREAIEFAEKENIRVILAQVRRPGNQLGRMKAANIPVVLGPTLALPLEEDDPYDSAYTLPAELHKAGIRFAFGTFSNSFSRNLPYQAAAAVAFGLPHEEALKAVTLSAADIWGVADQLGSIEKGKWADLALTDGDPLETRTQVKQLFIKGKQVSLENRHTQLYERYSNRP